MISRLAVVAGAGAGGGEEPSAAVTAHGLAQPGPSVDGEALHEVRLRVLEVLERDRARLEAAGDCLHLLHELGRTERTLTGRQGDVGIGVVAVLGRLLLPAFALGGLLGLLGAVALELVKRRSLRTPGTCLRESGFNRA